MPGEAAQLLPSVLPPELGLVPCLLEALLEHAEHRACQLSRSLGAHQDGKQMRQLVKPQLVCWLNALKLRQR